MAYINCRPNTSELIPDNANKISQCLPTTTSQQDRQEEEIRGRRKKRKTKEQRGAKALER